MFADQLDVTTVVFLALAIFVIWRLRSVLGQKTGHEQPPVDRFSRREQPEPPRPNAGPTDNVVRLPTGQAPAAPMPPPVPPQDRWAGIAPPDSPLAKGLDEIVKAEPGFDPRTFVEGSKSAYEMIVMAFAQGDVATLRTLLAKDVFDGFERAIKDRESRKEKVETTFVSIDEAKIVGAEARNRMGQVTVRFASKLITATRDAAGQVIDGSPEVVVDNIDVWTFARTLGARDPNWQLVATEADQ